MKKEANVSKLYVLNNDKTIFDYGEEYMIPLYQRAFAWEEEQIVQLIEDIYGVDENSDYYIGALIVSKCSERFEVVDGQQRLTTLYLLLNCLDCQTGFTLNFACRDKSNYTLMHISEIIKNDTNRFDLDKVEDNIREGIRVIQQEINKKNSNGEDFDKNKLKENLQKVILYRIEVPENTDLNRYFETMNVRGEQLQQHDILKAKLLNCLDDVAGREREVFAKIWDACSDMNGYVQMNFVSKGNVWRDKVFGEEWGCIPSLEWNDYLHIDDNKVEGENCTILDIISPNFSVQQIDGLTEENEETRFESVIEFPFLLMHALKVFIEINVIKHHISNKKLVDELLDDKKLLGNFESVINNGVTKNGMVLDKKEFAKEFVLCLLRTRWLFDKYFIKREYVNDSMDGKWSLKSLYVSGRGAKRKPYYKNTIFDYERGEEHRKENVEKAILMIQSALRVSYTSSKIMHWITVLLTWLFRKTIGGAEMKSFAIARSVISAEEYLNKIMVFTVLEVRKVFFDACADNVYCMGVNTPRIVFNYLDFWLWLKNIRKYADFTFEFRNSVEHWYPQNPSEGSIPLWKNEVDRFGNLCLVHRNVNSKFSNLSPDAKKSTYGDMIARGSLKLRYMSEATKNSAVWRDEDCAKHEREMIVALKEACCLSMVCDSNNDKDVSKSNNS